MKTKAYQRFTASVDGLSTDQMRRFYPFFFGAMASVVDQNTKDGVSEIDLNLIKWAAESARKYAVKMEE